MATFYIGTFSTVALAASLSKWSDSSFYLVAFSVSTLAFSIWCKVFLAYMLTLVSLTLISWFARIYLALISISVWFKVMFLDLFELFSVYITVVLAVELDATVVLAVEVLFFSRRAFYSFSSFSFSWIWCLTSKLCNLATKLCGPCFLTSAWVDGVGWIHTEDY